MRQIFECPECGFEAFTDDCECRILYPGTFIDQSKPPKERTMLNKTMERYLKKGELVDVSKFEEVEAGVYKLPGFDDEANMDYADCKKEFWIWSIGQDLATGVYYASTDCRFYQNPNYKCVFLR